MLHGGNAPPPRPIEGSYVARTLNGRALPAELRIPATAGDFRLFRLEQGVLRLSAGGRFTCISGTTISSFGVAPDRS